LRQIASDCLADRAGKSVDTVLKCEPLDPNWEYWENVKGDSAVHGEAKTRKLVSSKSIRAES
jgi:hypothetical protein